jgi:TetR/AcrR family transcriptional regulator, transcriptional repressor for nem operon
MKNRRKTAREPAGGKGAQTRREIVRRAAPVFNTKGYAGTSMSDLMRVTGLQKGGLYRHFDSKEELAEEAFDYAWEKAVTERLDGIAAKSNAIDRLKTMVTNFVEKRANLVPGGCPLLNTAIESDDGNPFLRARARDALATWTKRISEIARQGIRDGEIAPKLDPGDFADLIIATLEGALMMARLRQSQAAVRAAAAHLHEMLDALAI